MDVSSVNSTEALEQAKIWQEKMESGEIPPPPPDGKRPPGDMLQMTELGELMRDTEGLTEEEKVELMEFGQTLFESIRNGEFDAATLAENAPEALKELAEEHGIDLTAALTELAEDVESRQANGMPPGPPPEGAGDSDLPPWQTTVEDEDEEAV